MANCVPYDLANWTIRIELPNEAEEEADILRRGLDCWGNEGGLANLYTW